MSKSVSNPNIPRLGGYRAKVASRVVAAVGGGYALSAAWAAAGALGFYQLGMARSDATMAATMTSFIVYAVAALWCFGCASARRAWIGCAVPATAFALITWILMPEGHA